jgi:hypothetical protein
LHMGSRNAFYHLLTGTKPKNCIFFDFALDKSTDFW